MISNRSPNWAHEETSLLLALWSEENVQKEFKGSFRNKLIYTKISKRMAENGYRRTPDQCRDRIKRLRKAYQKAKDSNRTRIYFFQSDSKALLYKGKENLHIAPGIYVFTVLAMPIE